MEREKEGNSKGSYSGGWVSFIRYLVFTYFPLRFINKNSPSDTTDQKYGCHILLEDPEHDKVE
jgi:hypothetical protein